MNKKKKATGYGLIFGYIGVFLMVFAVIICIPLILIPFLSLLGEYGFRDAAYWPSFVFPALICLSIGLTLYFTLLYNRDRDRLGKHQDSLLLVLLWIFAILFCLLPFIFRNFKFFGQPGDKGMNFWSALFETTSGFCTVGLSTFSSEMLDPAWSGYYLFVFYRSVLLFVGGVGLVLVITSAISDRYGLNLYEAEGHSDRLFPNMKRSAKLILGIYSIYILIGTIAYVIAGMSIFDAINTSISAISTGGFTPHSESIAFYSMYPEKAGGFFTCRPLVIEIISIVLMVLGSTNFLTHFLLLRGKFKKVVKDTEIHLVLFLVVVCIPLLVFSVMINVANKLDLLTAIRYSIFTFFSCISTTGFTNVNTSLYSFYGGTVNVFTTASLFIMILLMFIGGGANSTAGAAKQHRIVLAFKGLYWDVIERVSPKELILHRHVYRHGDKISVSKNDVNEANSTIYIYLLTTIIGTLFVALLNNIDLQDSSFIFLSALSSTGISMSSVPFPVNGQTIKQIFTFLCLSTGMFVGRLEILPVFFAASRIKNDISKTY